ncbi:MAG: DNA repair protein RadA [Rhabdochlamydiaceae bacterium]|nr:DNA repair protein RadA [Rhabdochlamydiaceae bacterium]
MAKQKVVWSCLECGHRQAKWTGSCTICQKWNTFSEDVEIEDKLKRFDATGKPSAKPMRIKEVTANEFRRISTRMTEFDRLLGGGIVSGSLTLIGGDPGIGKSTLMLQLAQNLAQQGLIVLYICGEESVEQTSLRANRLKIGDDRLYLLSETLFSNIKLQIDQIKPDILIVDSIQIVYKSELPSSPGSVSQVRELATEFMHLAKGLGIATFLIGHVTKSGEIAGPRVLEHLVDTVLDFEGDRQHGYRLLRSTKNRFGPTDEIALFQMVSHGLAEVSNPSMLFLEERMREIAGSVILPTVEGTRALLIEVQALVAASSFSTSTRKSTGLDSNRLSLLLAVLEKRMGYQLHHCDVFVSIAGGLKIFEPAIDLGVLLAIASSFCNKPIHPETVVIGEVGLGGEVRSVPRIESRIKEAIHMGFQKCVMPKRNLKGLSSDLLKQIGCVGIDLVEDAIHEVIR